MASTEPSIASRLTGIGATVLTGMFLFIVGIIGVVLGDVGSDPTYHAGGMLIVSILFVFLYLIAELLLVPPAGLRAPRIHLAFLGWMGIGASIVAVIEHFNPGKCCSDPVIRGIIAKFSLAWPAAFAAFILVGLLVMAMRSKSQPVSVENEPRTNYPRD